MGATFSILALLVALDGRPTAEDRVRLPSEPVCRRNLDAAEERVRAVEWRAALSPSRAHLEAAELDAARALRDWWTLARTVAQEPYMDYDRDRMTCLRAQLGAAEWWCGAWPFLWEAAP